MPISILGRLDALTRRVLMVLAAMMLASAPGLMMSANAHVVAHDGSTPADFATLLDDTPDVGPVRDAPPPLDGAVNLYFMGVLPDEGLHALTSHSVAKRLWSLASCYPLGSCRLATPIRPPRR